ncbi:hypothetical protein EKO04_010985 [Ascochyta lentis]|uniref:Uncharacterized protein n=1 Tax=Ascochyta lentis TaxID=205686 RepID=A0A8H7MCS4_9PLEO|nr:hypothetical protein EKO04_010985 [Ascochyta lentis]
MAPSSARPPGSDPTYTALKHKLNVLRDEVASALEQARSTGFGEAPEWDLATVCQVAAYTDLHDEYWDMVLAAKVILSDLFLEHTGMLTRNASRPQSSTLVQQQRQASKSSPQHAFETQLESKALQPGRPKASLGPAIFREKAAREEAERARKQAEQQMKQLSEHQAVHVSKPEASKQPPRKPIGPEILTRLAFKARGDSQIGPPEKTTLAGSGQLSQMPQRGLNDKPSDRLASQTEPLYISSPPGRIARVPPPLTGNLSTTMTLLIDGWTKWNSGARLNESIEAVGPDNKPIMKDGKQAIAYKINPETYGGTEKYDLGLCEGILNGCPFSNWQWCPYRHWAPEPWEERWMDADWLTMNESKLQQVPHPPDYPKVN